MNKRDTSDIEVIQLIKNALQLIGHSYIHFILFVKIKIY